MPDTINDGGPAFPVHPNTNPAGEASGMSLRDWFAGQALAGFASIKNSIGNYDSDEEFVAQASKTLERQAAAAYVQADAMLAAREAR